MDRDGDDAWIDTITGPFWPAAPAPADVSPAAIAHALSHLCRFGGHTTRFYSVAQHSVLCMRQMPADNLRLRRAALLHDAAEAYVVDLPTPIKNLLPDYRRIELGVHEAVAERFSIPVELPDIVKRIDARLCVTEAAQLLAGKSGAWWLKPGQPEPLPIHIEPWSCEFACDVFLKELFEVWPHAA